MLEDRPGPEFDAYGMPEVGAEEAKLFERADLLKQLSSQIDELAEGWQNARELGDFDGAYDLFRQWRATFDYRTNIQNGIDAELRRIARREKIQATKSAIGRVLDLRRFFSKSGYDSAAQTLFPAVENSRLTGSESQDIFD